MFNGKEKYKITFKLIKQVSILLLTFGESLETK